jgi:hypothetical protein
LRSKPFRRIIFSRQDVRRPAVSQFLLATLFGHANNARAMATVLTTTAITQDCRNASEYREDEAISNATPLFRFRLRQLLAFVAAICALLTAIASVSGLTCLILLVAGAVIFMHVFATALSRRLQAGTDSERRRHSSFSNANADSSGIVQAQFASVQAIRSAPRSPWHGRGCTYLPWLPRLVIGAMILGGLVGAVLLSGLLGDRTSPEGIIVGALSVAVLGGWMAFLGGNFYGVFRHGFREALAEEQKDHLAATRVQR